MLNGSRYIRSWIRAGTRFNDASREKRHQEAIDELDRLLAEKSKSPLFTNTAKYFTSKKRRKTLKNLHEKVYKDTLYNQASRELIGFKFENHAAWVGCPQEICSLGECLTNKFNDDHVDTLKLGH